jgi:predicted lysophospholipase L1 biosynthesis ABC-type transport system permease subunit
MPLGVAGIAIGAICQIAERKDEEVWEQVQDTPAASVYPILSVVAALIVAAVCFAILGLGLEMTM